MDPVAIGYIGMAMMVLLILIGVPIGFALGAVGIVGITVVVGLSQALTQTTLIYVHEGTNFVLVAVPMFVLMGNLANHTGIAQGLFKAAAGTLGRLPGGLAIASVFGCAGFGAISGSSTATVMTMGRIVMPELNRYNYSSSLAAGVLAASGTLGILIPPSLILIFYGILTENSIGDLFIAGIAPGIMTVLIFSALILGISMRFPKMGPSVPSPGRQEMLRSLAGALPILGLFALVIGGIYFGVFTPTEASGIAVVGVTLYGLVTRTLTLQAVVQSLKETVVTSTMIFTIVVSGFLAITGLTTDLVDLIQSFNLGPVEFIIAITALYLVLGCILDVLAMIILTVPLFYPILMAYGFDPIWFGVYVVIVAEIGLITPPLGINLFVVKAISPGVKFLSIAKGVVPFVIAELFVIGIITAFPQIVLFLVP